MKLGYLWLWLLLLAGLIAVTAYSFVDDVDIYGWKPKKAPIAEQLTARPVAVSPDSIIFKALRTAELLTNPVDSTPQVFLLIGDSMTLNLAYRLNDYAEKNGHTAYAVNWDSSNTQKWSQSNRLDSFINEKKPTFVFISLGANELFMEKPEYLKPNVKKIVEKIGDIPFIWIGPPNWKPDLGLNDMLEATLPAGTFFRTDTMRLERRADHIHPTREASALWMDSVMRWSRRSAHPFVAEKPDHPAADPTKGIKLYKQGE